MKLLPVVLGIVILASACVNPGSTTTKSDPRTMGGKSTHFSAAALNGTLPAGCDASRPAIFHTYDGEAIDNPGVSVGVPCLVTSGFGSGEPSIGLTRDGSLFLYPGEKAPLPQLQAAEQFTGLFMVRSDDRGATFSQHFSRVGGAADYHQYTADPFMYVDPVTDRVFMEDLMVPPFNCANLSYSDDEGETWTQGVAGCLVWDHVSYYSGKPVSSTMGSYPTIVYRCGITYVMTTVISEATGCQKTVNGGLTWDPPGEPAYLFGPDGTPYVPSTCNGAAHHVTVDFRGWVWLPRGWCNDPYVSVSKDEGATWTQYHVYDHPMLFHDAGVGIDPAGTVYYAWIDGDDGLPRLSISKDDGVTWSAPRKITPPDVQHASNINLAAGGVGKIAITYGANIDADNGVGVHAVVSNVYAADSDRPVFETVFANPPERGVASGTCDGVCPGQGDFITMRLGPDGAPWMSVMNHDVVGAATIFGAPSLYDESDPNGPYPDE